MEKSTPTDSKRHNGDLTNLPFEGTHGDVPRAPAVALFVISLRAHEPQQSSDFRKNDVASITSRDRPRSKKWMREEKNPWAHGTPRLRCTTLWHGGCQMSRRSATGVRFWSCLPDAKCRSGVCVWRSFSSVVLGEESQRLGIRYHPKTQRHSTRSSFAATRHAKVEAPNLGVPTRNEPSSERFVRTGVGLSSPFHCIE